LKKKGLLWLGIMTAIILFLIYPSTRSVFLDAVKEHPYIMGFVKFSILATMGELLAIKITVGEFKNPAGLIYRFIIWGLLGMLFALTFPLFAAGVKGCMNAKLLPVITGNKFGNDLLTAFFTSAIMNIIFAPTFMFFHRITDTFIDLGEGKLSKIFKVSLADVVKKIDWTGFISFVLLKTIPFFWIPAHTITFMLPKQYQVLMAAFLSIALGAILAFSKRKMPKPA